MTPRRFQPEQLERLYEVARAIHATLEPAGALQLVVREAVQLVGASSGSLALINPTNGLLEIEAAEGLPEHGAALTLRLDEGITGWGETRRAGAARRRERGRAVHLRRAGGAQ